MGKLEDSDISNRITSEPLITMVPQHPAQSLNPLHLMASQSPGYRHCNTKYNGLAGPGLRDRVAVLGFRRLGIHSCS